MELNNKYTCCVCSVRLDGADYYVEGVHIVSIEDKDYHFFIVNGVCYQKVANYVDVQSQGAFAIVELIT